MQLAAVEKTRCVWTHQQEEYFQKKPHDDGVKKSCLKCGLGWIISAKPVSWFSYCTYVKWSLKCGKSIWGTYDMIWCRLHLTKHTPKWRKQATSHNVLAAYNVLPECKHLLLLYQIHPWNSMFALISSKHWSHISKQRCWKHPENLKNTY